MSSDMDQGMAGDDVHELTAEFALGLLDGVERAAAEAHVAGCAECQALVADFSAIGEQLIEAAPEADPPAGFAERVLARIQAESGGTVDSVGVPSAGGVVSLDGQRARRRPLSRWLLGAAAAVIAALALGAGFLVGRGQQSAAPVRSAVMLNPAGDAIGKIELGRNPNTVVVAMPKWFENRPKTTTYRMELVLDDTSRVTFDNVVLAEGGLYAMPLAVDPGRVRAVEVFNADGSLACHATLG